MLPTDAFLARPGDHITTGAAAIDAHFRAALSTWTNLLIQLLICDVDPF